MCSVQLESSCVVLLQRNSSAFPSSCPPLTHPNIYSLSSIPADWRVSLHTYLNTKMHMESCRTAVGLQTPWWPQECECRHFTRTHTNTQTHTHADRSKGWRHVTAVHSDRRLQLLRGMKGKGSKRATLRRNRNTMKRKTPAVILRPADPYCSVTRITFKNDTG